MPKKRHKLRKANPVGVLTKRSGKHTGSYTKASPTFAKIINDQRRRRNLTLEEWRNEYSDNFDATCKMFYGNLVSRCGRYLTRPYTIQYSYVMEEIRQHYEILFFEIWHLFEHGYFPGKSEYTGKESLFPPDPRSFFVYGRQRCLKLFERVNLIWVSHRVLPKRRQGHEYNPNEVEDVKALSKGELYSNFYSIVTKDMTPAELLLFELWWQGLTVLQIANLCGMGERAVHNRLSYMYRDIQALTGLGRLAVKKIRKVHCQSTDPKDL